MSRCEKAGSDSEASQQAAEVVKGCMLPLSGAMEWPCTRPERAESECGNVDAMHKDGDDTDEDRCSQDSIDLGEDEYDMLQDDTMQYSERPRFPIVMLLKHLPGLRNCKSLGEVKETVGKLPESCNIKFINLVNVTATVNEETMHMILPPGKMLSLIEEEQQFGSEANPLSQIFQAGHFKPQQRNIMALIRNEPSGKREEIYYNFMAIQVHFLQAHLCNNSLLNLNAQFGMKYLQQGGARVFEDLRQLRHEVVIQKGRAEAQAVGDRARATFWRATQINPVACYAWEYHVLCKHFYSDIVELHPQNYNFRTNVIYSNIMFRLAHDQPEWTGIGAWIILCDAAGKMPSTE